MSAPLSFRLLRLIGPRLMPRSVAASIGERSVVHPRRVRGRGGNRLVIGADSIVLGELVFERPGAEISVGDRSFIGRSLLAAATRIEIGSDVLVSWGVTIVDHHSHALSFADRRADVTDWLAGKKDWSRVPSSPISVGDKCWIGFEAALLAGTRLGEGAVVGARALVTRDVEPWTVVAGVPARVVRRLDPTDGMAERFERSPPEAMGQA
jgi:galactoside O-acetyltransferase